MAKINLQRYEDFTEANQRAQYFYGRMSLDNQCSNCGNVTEAQEMCEQEPCQNCGEWSGWIEMEN